jgi:hypothetical protein
VVIETFSYYWLIKSLPLKNVMGNTKVTFIPAKKDGENFLRVSQTDYDEIGLGVTKTGFMPVQPEKAEQIIDMVDNGQLGFTFGDKLPTGLYEISVVKADELVEKN